MEQVNSSKKRLVLYAAVAFALTSVAAIVVNSLLGHGWHIEYSISRYVGLETWSALVFFLGNLVVAGCVLYYLEYIAEIWGLPRWFNWLVVIMLITLLVLSACPIGYFDLPGAAYGTSAPSNLHGICSRMMFCSMILAGAVFALTTKATKHTRIMAGIFVAYGLLCVYGYFMKASWLASGLVFFEWSFLMAFLGLCGILKSKKSEG